MISWRYMEKVEIEGKSYFYEVPSKIDVPEDAVHIVQPCHNSIELTKLSIECIKRYTDCHYVLWIVDNCSDSNTRKFLSRLDGVNVIFNRTKIGSSLPWRRTPYIGSRSNAIALELAAHVINDCKYMFVMHNDCVPVNLGWLEFLKSKINKDVRIAGVSQDKTRICAVHQSGFIFDFELYKKLGLSFMPRMPEYDVGDGITLGLLANGYNSFVCKNTFNNPEMLCYLDEGFLKQYIFDKSFNDDNELIYMHMGRGSNRWRDFFLKDGRVRKKEWIEYVREQYLP